MFDIALRGSPDAAGPPVAGGRSEGGAFSDVSGAVLAHLLVPTLADLDAVPDGIAGDAMLVDLASDLARLEAWAVAQRARVLGTLVRRTEAELQRFGAAVHSDGHGTAAAASHAFDDQRMAHRMVSTDLALATGTTTWVADRELDLAHGLTAHPRLATALANGRVDRRRTELVLAEVANLGEADRDRVIAKVVGDGTHAADDAGARDDLIRELRRPGTFLWQLPSAVLRRAVRRECAAIDADQAAKREALARINRHVTARSLPDAMGEFRIEAPAHAVSLMYANVDAAARAARARGDDRTLDQLRADISIGWLTEGALGTFVARPQPRSRSRSRPRSAPRPLNAPDMRSACQPAPTSQHPRERRGRALPDGAAPAGERADGHRDGRPAVLWVRAKTQPHSSARTVRSRSRRRWPGRSLTTRRCRPGSGCSPTPAPASRSMCHRTTGHHHDCAPSCDCATGCDRACP